MRYAELPKSQLEVLCTQFGVHFSTFVFNKKNQ